MPRFVILRHETPPGYERPLHWDLMLETEGDLRTWALVSEPIGNCDVDCELLPNHRLAYLDFEGPVSGDRGVVSRCDFGTFQWRKNEESHIEAILQGQRGECHLTLEKKSVAGVWFARFRQSPAVNHERPVS